jgi:hypothetical protein
MGSKSFSARLRALLCCGLLAATGVTLVPAQASEAVPKQVHLIVDGNRLIASNARFSRFDELKFNAREKLIRKAEGKAAIVVFTDQRIIGYGVLSGWQTIRTEADEKLEELQVEDFAALVMTNNRLLNFNGESGVWAERARPAGR